MFTNIYSIPKSYYLISQHIDEKNQSSVSLYNFLIGAGKLSSFTQLYKKLLTDLYLNNENKNILFHKLCKLKRIYFLIYKYSFKFRKINFYNNFDLMLQDFYQSDNTIIIREGRSYFKFRLYELINIIENALLNTEYNELKPKEPKNPYTNTIFSKSTLYNIFIYQRFSWFKISQLFYLYYVEDFNIMTFFNNNYNYLVDINNGRKINNLTSTDYIDEVNKMLQLFNSKKKLNINIPYDFPISVLRKHFNEYMKTFYMIKNCKNNSQFYNNILLIKSLVLINKKNPLYGRKIYKLKYEKTNLNPFDFNKKDSKINFKNNKIKILKKMCFITKFIKPTPEEINSLKILVTIPDPITSLINSIINPGMITEDQNLVFPNVELSPTSSNLQDDRVIFGSNTSTETFNTVSARNRNEITPSPINTPRNSRDNYLF